MIVGDEVTSRNPRRAVRGLSKHHHATMQVFAEGERRSRLVWITDMLPAEVAVPIGALVEKGSDIIKRTLEAESGDIA